MNKLRLSVLILYIAIAAVGGGLLFSSQANAAVGNGGSSPPSRWCNGGGINGCPWTSNAHGWYMIPIDSSSAPIGDAGYWNTASSLCRAENASHVLAYVVFTGERNLRNAWLYQFQWYWDGDPWTSIGPYTPGNVAVGDAQGVDPSVANAVFDALPAWQRSGYSFGSNVGWMCYYSENWSSTGSSTADRTTARPGDTITWTHSLRNNGPTRSGTVQSQTVNSGFARPEFNGTQNVEVGAMDSGATRNPNMYATYTVSRADMGGVLCQQLQWDPTNSSGGRNGRASNACVTIVSAPLVNVLGGDLLVGRSSVYNSAPTAGSRVTTSSAVLDGSNLYGSWAEYGIVASGRILGMASGSGYAGGYSRGNDFCRVSTLSFTNADTGGCNPSSVGRYTTGTTAPDVASRFRTNTSTRSLPSSTVDITGQNLSGLYRTTEPTITIRSSGEIPAGRSVIINAPGTDVTITSNIAYTNGTLTTVANIPQVVIIARSISIANTTYNSRPLTNVDAWLVAVGAGNAGYINTCASVTPGSPTNATLNATTCNNRLTVNGPIVTNKLYLYRTAGAQAGSTAGDPAEVFNLRADAYVWGSGYSAGTGRVPTVSTKELPPRF